MDLCERIDPHGRRGSLLLLLVGGRVHVCLLVVIRRAGLVFPGQLFHSGHLEATTIPTTGTLFSWFSVSTLWPPN